MKYKLLPVIAAIAILVSCKKDNQKLQPVIASPVELASINAKLIGTWAYQNWNVQFKNLGSVPGNNIIPFDASMVFSERSNNVLRYGYDLTQLNSLPYQLSGQDGKFYITITDAQNNARKCEIKLLTADSLKVQNIITSNDTTKKIIVDEVWTKADPKEVAENLFKIKLNSTAKGWLYNPGATVTVYVTSNGGAERIVDQQSGVTQSYSFSFRPAAGDHIRLAITDGNGRSAYSIKSFNNSPNVVAYYKGVAYGDEWTSLASRNSENHQWDITK